MNKKLLAAASVLVLASCGGKVAGPAIPRDNDIEKRIDKVMKRLTLEEKIGQMTQLTIDNVTGFGNGPVVQDVLLEKAIGEYKVGSILNVPDGHAQTPEVYAAILSKIQEKSMEVMGIPCLYGLDQIHGATYTAGATFFPQEVNLAATFNRQYARDLGEITAYETRASMVPWTFSPVMDLGRNPAWPRMWESFGEDAYMNATMAVEVVRGLQGDDPNHVDQNHIAACLKHYMAYGVPVSGKDRTPSSVTESDLREKYFEPFRACIEAGALSLMVNSASNNGLPFHANHELLTVWLKEQLGWDGMIVTDWADINNLYTREHIAVDEKDAVRIAINAGIDMSMVPYSTSFCDCLKELVDEGLVPMSRIDDACRRVLRLKFRLGLFDNPVWDASQYGDFASAESASKSFAAAVESEVLLKNEGVLPVREGARILVTGPNGDSMRTLNGGWSYTWQGDGAANDEFTGQYNTIYEALSRRFGASNVKYVPGVVYEGPSWPDENASGIAAAVSAARSADVIFACIGENTYCETPGNMNDLALSANQQELVRALAATGKPVVLVLNEGRPRIIRDIEPLAKAVVHVLLPSNYGGDALAALVSGDENFSGRLPFTYPKYVNAFATYDYKVSENTATMAGAYNYDAVMDVQWPFGFGFSYTSFEYSNLTVDKAEFTADDVLTFRVDVTNTGDRAGKEAVALYSSDIVAGSVPDVKRLRNFEKIDLQPGQTGTVELTVRASDLAFVGYDRHWRLEKGDFRFAVGTQSVMAKCLSDKVWDTPNR